LKAEAKTKQSVINDIETNLASKSFLEQENKCVQSTSSSQSNSVSNLECVKQLMDVNKMAIENNMEVPFSAADIKEVAGVTNVIQDNNSSQEVTCKMKLLLGALSKMKASVDNSALQKALTEAKGIASSADSDQMNCNAIKTNISACKYVTQEQCCSQDARSTQENIFEGCAANNIQQRNTSKSTALCLQSSELTVTDDQTSDIKNTVDQSAKTKAIGMNGCACCIIVIVIMVMCCCCPCITPMVLAGNSLTACKWIFLLIGLIMTTIGIIFFNYSSFESYRVFLKKKKY
jgi:hypothetical protein